MTTLKEYASKLLLKGKKFDLKIGDVNFTIKVNGALILCSFKQNISGVDDNALFSTLGSVPLSDLVSFMNEVTHTLSHSDDFKEINYDYVLNKLMELTYDSAAVS